MVLEDSLKSWAKPPGATEQAKCDNAVRMIRQATEASQTLRDKSISVFVQGSYRSRTNVRQDSDVDVCVLYTGSFFFDLPQGVSLARFGLNSPATYQYSKFKVDVEEALRASFEPQGMQRGKKAFDIHANSYRVDADVVPAFEYRFYHEDGTWRTGTAFIPDGGNRIFNYPEQNYANGVLKNKTTGGRFKDVVRILKRLRNRMNDEGIAASMSAPSFLIESLVWNVPNGCFGHDSYVADVRDVLATMFLNTMKPEDCIRCTEVNGFKFLFHATQPWNVNQAHAFASAAWDYLGFQ
jgi:hypothetical protein